MPIPVVPREECYRCMRPALMCLCADIPEVHTRTDLVVLQHPRERFHPFGTVRLVALALPRARVVVAGGGLDGNLHRPVSVPADAAILYPHARATDLADLLPAERPSTLVALDGTWAHSRRLYKENPWLHELRHVRINPSEPGRYRIRREPRADYLSTVESIVAALRLLEPETEGLDRLLQAFDRMIDRQIAHVARVGTQGRVKRTRQRAWRRLPDELAAGNLVVVYGETNLPGGDRSGPRELVQWTAARVDTGATFEAFLQPAAGPLGDVQLAHMGLRAEQIRGGASTATVRAEFAAFAGAAPTLAAWGPNTLTLARRVLGFAGPQVVLKRCYCNLRNASSGLLDDVMAREGLTAAATSCHGRARARLGNALALAQWLRAIQAERAAVGHDDE